jgi:hypothetical protein
MDEGKEEGPKTSGVTLCYGQNRAEMMVAVVNSVSEFGGLAVRLAREQEGNWRGEGGLLIGVCRISIRQGVMQGVMRN